MDEFHQSVPVAGVLSPRPGEYAAVFDSATRGGAGAFTFRYWVNDVTPPALRLRTRSVRVGRPPRVDQDHGRRLAQTWDSPWTPPLDPDRRAHRRDASPAGPRLRLPGVEEHGERRAHPSQHALVHGDVHDPYLSSA
jgi:hypothetical protein